MTTGCHWRGLRMAFVLVALFGVALMHSLATPMPGHGAMAAADPPRASAAAVTDLAAVVVAVAVGHEERGHEEGGHDPVPMSHDIGHLCLAVLGAALVLLLFVALLLVGRPVDVRGRPVAAVAFDGRRPPPRTAVRLAQLCVLRN